LLCLLLRNFLVSQEAKSPFWHNPSEDFFRALQAVSTSFFQCEWSGRGIFLALQTNSSFLRQSCRLGLRSGRDLFTGVLSLGSSEM
jgi:hypothetical protein